MTNKIKIAITTHNRYDVFKQSYDKWKEFLPEGAELIVVDDGSKVPVPEADFRFDKAQGISVAKNKCFELLGEADHYFLVDDDIYPTRPDWFEPYINSGQNHLCLGFDKFSNGGKNGHIKVTVVKNLVYWKEPCGLMLYFKPICLEKVGGFNPEYKVWGGEHADLSQRIFNSGLTKYPFMDVKNSLDYFYSFDQDQKCVRSVDPRVRAINFQQNKKLLEKYKDSSQFIHFKSEKHLNITSTKSLVKYDDQIPEKYKNSPSVYFNGVIITCLFTKIIDPQKGEKWKLDESCLDNLVNSLSGQNLIVLTDTDLMGREGVEFVKIDQIFSENPYFQRWFAIRQYLQDKAFEKVFICDATDVELLRNPFPHLNPQWLYLGDEQGQVLSNTWLVNRHPNEIYHRMYRLGARWPLLNAGLCGGYLQNVKKFVDLLCDHYRDYGINDFTDMAAFNYIAYLHFKGKIVHGKYVNTVFKAYKDNGLAFFKHK